MHKIVTKNLREIRLILANGVINEENGNNLKQILRMFSMLCYLDGDRNGDCHPINQQILVNCGML